MLDVIALCTVDPVTKSKEMDLRMAVMMMMRRRRITEE